VVTNLLSNAGKYTPPRGKIRITLTRVEDLAILSVADTGIGIDPELLPRIFDLFTQGERSLDRREGGLGVGLTLVRSLVELHGGTVEARSEGLGSGSEIIVRLPVAKDLTLPPETPAEVNVIRPEAAGAANTPPRILVVDDNQDGADTLVELGEAWGYELRAAYNGAAAIELARSYCPHVVLLDIGLPGLDGYEVARRLRSEIRLAGVKLVAFTGYGSNDDRERARKAGFDHHITKPVNSEELRSLLFALAPPAAEARIAGPDQNKAHEIEHA
jgi:CheY-like chemotaxis protein